jgi:acetolactate synthase I/II/III large subunit
MTIRLSDYIANRLFAIGVKTVFLVAGGGMMHLIDALGRIEGLHYMCNHHEQASAIAADAYARQTGSLGVCYATSGPGATNILTGLVGAWQDSSPVLFLTGQSKLSETVRGAGIHGLRQFGTFEVDIVPIVKSVTKYAVFLDDPQNVRYELEKAIHLARSGRPGPVLIDVPLDIQGAPVDPQALVGYTAPAEVGNDFDGIAQDILGRLRASKRPLILAGWGVRCAKAVLLFREMINRLGVPVAVTPLGKDILTYDDPLFSGHPGVKGDRPGNFAVQNADLILSLGNSLHTQTTGYEFDHFAPNAYKIQVEPDEAVLKKITVHVDKKINSSIVPIMESLTKLAAMGWDASAYDDWRKRCVDWKIRYAVNREPHRVDEGPVNYYEFADVLSNLLKGDETIVADAGSAFYVMGQALRLKGTQRFISSGSMGAMGFTLPAGLGVCASDPNRLAVCVTGDGALQSNIQELQTLRHNNFNLKLFVIQNDGYVSIRNTQKAFFGGHFVGSSIDSGVSMPPLEKIANAYEIPFIQCAYRAQLIDAVRQTLEAKGPVICGIKAQADQSIIPSVSSVRLPNGRMQSKPLHDMFPFLSEEDLRMNMVV